MSSTSDGNRPGVNRRELLKAAGAGLTSLAPPSRPLTLLANPSMPVNSCSDHERLIPADKQLPAGWVRSLFEKGARRIYRGKELETIGMPIGGVGAGQLYLRGDGTLGCWYIFNKRFYSGSGGQSYRRRIPDTPVEQGFAVVLEEGQHRRVAPLDRSGFSDVAFVGEYPIGRIRYRDTSHKLCVELEALSPFIPLNAADSSLPATLCHITLTNGSDGPLRVRVAAWLQNAVCFYTASDLTGTRGTRFIRDAGGTILLHEAAGQPREDAPQNATRLPIVLADFEGPDYGAWKTTGDAFGTRPATGTLPGQNSVLGFQGKGLVNTHLAANEPQGTLTSPPFRIERRYLNFLVGGGSHAGKTCVNLRVGEKVVRTATGADGEPLAWHTWNVEEFAGKEGLIEILDLHSATWGHINVDQIELSDVPRRVMGRVEDADDYGSMVLALAGKSAPPEEARQVLSTSRLENPAVEDRQAPINSKYEGALVTPSIELAAGASKTFTFVLAWHFPNRKTLSQDTGHAYATRFADAKDVAQYLLKHHARLAGDTRRWHETYYDSTLPHWLLDRVGSTVSCLATCTCELWRDGRFWAWEGVYCCPGTCTHVWNYAHAMARLFPELERSVREKQDLGIGLQAGGLVGFRGEHNVTPAADGQMGTILKCYREHQMSADDGFLRRNWAGIRKTLEYALAMDENADGLVEGEQHNTFDIEFFGANTFVGSLYLAALRAGEEMAAEMGEADLGARLRQVFDRGRRQSVEKLWNGEYFIQQVDLAKHPENQYGPGCLSDQLFGQGWAHQVNLGYIYPADHVKRVLQAIWRYNWAPDVGPYATAHKPARFFAESGEAGLFTCTWPRSAYLEKGVRFKDEVWTGIEYQVASHMIAEGMLTEGLAIARAIHDRYEPIKRNPFNEVECGDHYARALASWGFLLSLAGYEYHGPRKHLAFAPRLTPESFRCSFTAAEGWGTFVQTVESGAQRQQIHVRWGRLALRTLGFTLMERKEKIDATVSVGGKRRDAAVVLDGNRVTVTLARELVLEKDDVLEIRMI